MKQSNIRHETVLLTEAVQGLHVRKNGWYVDATLGTAGHTGEILKLGGKVVGIDQDLRAIELVKENLGELEELILVNDNFENLTKILDELQIKEVKGVLMDLGTSLIQLSEPERGFSFLVDENLDMRMNQDLQVTAKDLVNGLGRNELNELFKKYSQERNARLISQLIVEKRVDEPITTTADLAKICEAAYGGRRGKIHPATKVFQALRMAVNDEVNVLKNVLPQIEDSLEVGGRMAVISFHEGEDRVVKQFINQSNKLLGITRKPIMPTSTEVQNNPRARSAKLRIAEKI